ncbi:hypothetical protein [Methylomonas koyamae]|nr:hypothetical protein [Methylomonas koyamae]
MDETALQTNITDGSKQWPPQGILQHALFDLPENVLKSLANNLDVLVKEMKIKDDEAAMQPINPLPKKSPSLKREPAPKN